MNEHTDLKKVYEGALLKLGEQVSQQAIDLALAHTQVEVLQAKLEAYQNEETEEVEENGGIIDEEST